MRQWWRWGAVVAPLLAMPAAAETPMRPERHPDHWRMVLRGITLHLPHAYTETVFGSDGFRIVLFASDGRPYNRQTDPFGQRQRRPRGHV
ncbi:MAG: hypothetical protein K2X11_07500 [Acetobacteraceae bacterium]|nr:hypothetical protein [Acetobacteraceae bacterium]